MAEEFHGTEGIPIFLSTEIGSGGCWVSTENTGNTGNKKNKWNTGTSLKKPLKARHIGHNYGRHGNLNVATGHTKINQSIIMCSYHKPQ